MSGLETLERGWSWQSLIAEASEQVFAESPLPALMVTLAAAAPEQAAVVLCPVFASAEFAAEWARPVARSVLVVLMVLVLELGVSAVGMNPVAAARDSAAD